MNDHPTPDPRPPTPEKHTSLLAIALYLQAQLTEGQLARKLGLDRLETRARVAEFLDSAIENASVPLASTGHFVERISTLETRLATTLSQLDAEQLKSHDLRNEVQRLSLQAEELQIDLDTALRDLAAEREHLAELAREQAERSAPINK